MSGKEFKEYFFNTCKCKEIEDYIRSITIIL
ncbi:hypothetical protein GKZ28_08940 [Clostridium chromiireducens]|uniref:Ribose-5-phosphate isomerase C-terminal domain-containing protein n=1 Tax=Clostridium chromiireducens TaxID=225345 RepID=A0A964W209_9CLOT|nr:hypothetical protein [Clostridium chromiireducens]